MQYMKPVLLLQSRPEDVVSDNEYDAFCRMAALEPSQMHRMRIERDELVELPLDDYSAVIMGGGPANIAYPEDQKSLEQKRFEPWLFGQLRRIIDADKPFLGVCLGYGAITKLLGGEVMLGVSEPTEAVKVTILNDAVDDDLLRGIPREFDAFVGHKEGVVTVPAPAVELARSATCSQMLRVGENVYATQFHPELSADGLALRIQAYRYAGYFAPEEADLLIQAAHSSTVTWPEKILQNFITKYVI